MRFKSCFPMLHQSEKPPYLGVSYPYINSCDFLKFERRHALAHPYAGSMLARSEHIERLHDALPPGVSRYCQCLVNARIKEQAEASARANDQAEASARARAKEEAEMSARAEEEAEASARKKEVEAQLERHHQAAIMVQHAWR